MSAFCEDQSKWETYFTAITGDKTPEALNLRLFEWYPNAAQTAQELTVPTAAALIDRDQAPGDAAATLRVVMAPLGASCMAELEARKLLFRHYAFPTATLSERIQAVTNSFGTSTVSELLDGTRPGVDVAWTHFLCKDLAVRWVAPGPTQTTLSVVDKGVFRDSQSPAAGTSWRTSDYYLHVRQRSATARTVTLLCFGPPEALVERVRRLLHNASWPDAVAEPYLLFSIVYDELYRVVDDLAWQLADVFRPIERATLARARSDSHHLLSASTAVDFTGLHNISKTCIYMNEAVAAARLTLSAMQTHLARHPPPAPPPSSSSSSPGPGTAGYDDATTTPRLTSACLASLAYRHTMFQSTHLRLQSLEKRIANMLALSFNLVTQHDSRTMQNDSNAMKAIAVLTLVFLPATGISSVFSTPFFAVDFAAGDDHFLKVAACFWIFWVVAVPVTAAIVALWFAWYRQTKRRRREGAGQGGSWGWRESAKSGRARFRQYSFSQ